MKNDMDAYELRYSIRKENRVMKSKERKTYSYLISNYYLGIIFTKLTFDYKIV
jgi:hypothetical protein